MNKIHEWINTVGIIAIFILVLVGGDQSGPLGAVGTRFPNGLSVGSTASTTQNKLTIGNTGQAIANVIHGICNPRINSGWLTATNASNTMKATCAITDVTSSDRVMVQLPQNSTGITSRVGFWITGASATTSGLIGFDIFNGSGAATTSFSQATTSVDYWIFR